MIAGGNPGITGIRKVPNRGHALTADAAVDAIVHDSTDCTKAYIEVGPTKAHPHRRRSLERASDAGIAVIRRSAARVSRRGLNAPAFAAPDGSAGCRRESDRVGQHGGTDGPGQSGAGVRWAGMQAGGPRRPSLHSLAMGYLYGLDPRGSSLTLSPR